MDLMAEITCDEVLDLAYDRLCRRRERTSHNNDVWDVHWRWVDLLPTAPRKPLPATSECSTASCTQPSSRSAFRC
jgi:hypothetical protein